MKAGLAICPFSSTRFRTCANFSNNCNGSACNSATLHPSAHGALGALHLFARIFQFLTNQLIDSTFTGGGNVFTARGLKLKPGWLRAQFMHLENRNPSLLNECVHLLSVGCVCRHHAAPSQFFHCQLLCIDCKQLCSPCEANFLSPHPTLCPTTHLFQGWGNDVASQPPSAFHSAIHQAYGTTPDHRLDQRVCEVV